MTIFSVCQILCEVYAKANYVIFFLTKILTFLFLTVFQVVQLLRLKNWQCPRTKVSLILPKLGSVLTRFTGMILPGHAWYTIHVMLLHNGSVTSRVLVHTMAQPLFSATNIRWRGWSSWSYCHLNELLDPPEVLLEINLCKGNIMWMNLKELKYMVIYINKNLHY